MYYPILKNKGHFYCHWIAILFVISFLTITNYTNSFAQLLDENAKDYHLKGYEESQRGHPDLALTYYKKALSLGVRDPAIFNDIGIVYERLGVQDSAEHSYLQAIKLQSNYLPAYTNLGYFYLANNNKNKAIFYFQERIRRADASDPWRGKLEAFLYEIDPDLKKQFIMNKAEVLSREIVKRAHEKFAMEIARSSRHYLKGQEYLQDQQYDNAIDEFNLGLAITPNNPKLLNAVKQVEEEMEIDLLKKRAEDAMEQLNAGDLMSAKQKFQEILATIPEESNHKSE